jgi:hypothetical protein
VSGSQELNGNKVFAQNKKITRKIKGLEVWSQKLTVKPRDCERIKGLKNIIL